MEGSTGVAYPRAAAALAGVAIAAIGLRILSIFTENINWDEFALLNRAVTTLSTGDLMGGGRPGLGTLVLIPFAAECRNAVDALVQARVLWTAMVLASAAAFWFLLRGVLRPSPHRWLALATGVGLWVLAAPFLRYSVHVRTDQPAILFGLLGGLALMASRRRLWWAAPAGALLGIGFLFTQKLVYLAALVAVLAAGQILVDRQLDVRREMIRGGVTAGAFLLLVLGYRQLADVLFGAPALLPLQGGLTVFDHYRATIGWAHYRRMLPLLVPHLVVVALFLLLTLRSRSSSSPRRREMAVGWVVLGLGLFVMWFHAGRFPYFFLVLGLFPATLGAIATDMLMHRYASVRVRGLVLSAVWAPLLALGFQKAAVLMVDMQSHQPESLAFVERNFSPGSSGFNTHGVFACRTAADPFPVRFGQQARREFGTPDGQERARRFMDELRERPVRFMIPPPRGHPFPPEIWEFFDTRYVHYFGAVHVPGREVAGGPGWSGTFEVVAPGDYVWRPDPAARTPLQVADLIVTGPNETVRLPDRGEVTLRLPEGGAGLLVLSLPEPPSADRVPFFRGF